MPRNGQNVNNENLLRVGQPKDKYDDKKYIQLKEQNKPREALQSIQANVVEPIADIGNNKKTNVKFCASSHARDGVANFFYSEQEHIDCFQFGEYSLRVFQYLWLLEERSILPEDFMSKQTDINDKMRSILVDWMAQVHQRFNLVQETLFIAIQLLDRLINSRIVKRSEFQLMGVTCLLLATKYEEQCVPEISDFIHVTDNSCSSLQIRVMECTILKAIDYDLSAPVSLQFLRRITKLCQINHRTHQLSKYFLEVSLSDSWVSLFRPSYVAAASVFLAMIVLKETQLKEKVEYISGYCVEHLTVLMRRIPSFIMKNQEFNLNATLNKYAAKSLGFVSISQEIYSEEFRNFTYFCS